MVRISNRDLLPAQVRLHCAPLQVIAPRWYNRDGGYMTERTDLNPLDPRNVLTVNASPLQRGAGDVLVRSAVVGGPDVAGDRRVYLSSGLLAGLLDHARTSTMGRVRVDRAGVRVDLYRTSTGHEYEVWTLVGADPHPEPLPAAIAALASGD